MDALLKQGEKLKKSVKEKTKEFADKHPDEIAKLKSTTQKVIDTTQKQVGKGVEKIRNDPNVSSLFSKAKLDKESSVRRKSNESTVEEIQERDSKYDEPELPDEPSQKEESFLEASTPDIVEEEEVVKEAEAVVEETETAQPKEEEKHEEQEIPEELSEKMPSEEEDKATFEYPKRLSEAVSDVNEKNADSDASVDGDPEDTKSDGSSGGGSGSGSDSEDWEDSGDECWPAQSTTRYAPVGDAKSKVSTKGSSRLAREFTMGAGFHHLNPAGSRTLATSDSKGKLMLPVDEKLAKYNSSALELIKKNQLDGLMVSKPTYIDKVLLITDAPHAVRLYIGDEDGPCIVGMALIRDDIIFTSGILSEEYQKPLTLTLDPDEPIFESIELQCCTFLEGGDGRVEKKISYMLLRGASGETIVFGEAREEGFDGKTSLYSPVESTTGKLCISGVGFFDNKPISLQVVDLGQDCDNVLDAMDTNVYYNNGVISGNVIRTRTKEVEFLNSITTENDDVWDVLLGCMDAVENSSPSHGELLPNAVNLFEAALGGNVETIHSVLRLDRYLTHVIQNQKKVETFENDNLNFYAKLIPMKQMLGIFSNCIERIKRINNVQPELNSFNVAFLQGTDEFMMQAVFIFLTQAALLILTISHIWVHREDAFHIPSPLRFLVAICGTAVVNFMAKQSKNNFEDFEQIFPEYVGTTMYKLDAFSNIVCGKLVTISTLVLLMMTDDNLDIVLNATALLFVLELDESLVDTNPIWVTGVYRAYFMKGINKELNASDSRYWDPDYLRKDRGQHYRLHLPSCSLLFPNK